MTASPIRLFLERYGRLYVVSISTSSRCNYCGLLPLFPFERSIVAAFELVTFEQEKNSGNSQRQKRRDHKGISDLNMLAACEYLHRE